MTMETPKASYYDWMVAHDILQHLRPLWEQGGWRLREDGKLVADPKTAIEGPWHYIKHRWELDCYTWHHIIFEHISKRLVIGQKFVPARCQECFKVVVRPKTLKQLFALEKLQISMDRPCKCGIEVRDTVHGLYGGYFYNIGLQEGLERYQEVRAAVDADKHLGPDVPVLLKRACTEFELECGPSDQWQTTPEQLQMEAMVDQFISKDDVLRVQPDHVIWHLHRKWIEFAYANGDGTYAEFTDGRPLYPPVVTYHHLAPSAPGTGSPEKAEG
jgi:hypothetical protein